MNIPEIWCECRTKSRGERRLAQTLSATCDGDTILCFNVGFIPGGREIDLLLVHKHLGVYVIEVKAVPLHAIESISAQAWQIAGRGSAESPLNQAYDQYEGLRSFWNARMRSRLPPVAVTVCLPEISRSEWESAFTNSPYGRDLAEKLIFREDLLDAQILNNRLLDIMRDPPIRKGRDPGSPSEQFLADFRALLDPFIPEVATASDRARLLAIEKGITKKLRGEFPPGGERFIAFSGQPGTGKTFRLLAIGLHHAYNQKRVLFVCFNKTLASDIRRLLAFEEKLKVADSRVRAFDVFQIARKCFDANGLSFMKGGNPDEWGELVVARLRELGDEAIREEYDTVLIDEAHDMKDWQLDLIRMHAAKNATVCLALGKGQELYRDDSSATMWLQQIAKSSRVEQRELRTNFRNPTEQFFAALAFYRGWPDHFSQVAICFEEVLGKRRQASLSFERHGEPLQYVPVPEIPGEFDCEGFDQVELVSEEYAELIGNEVDSLCQDSGGHPVGMLVLVPSRESQVCTWVRSALDKVVGRRSGVSFIDYTDDDTKWVSARANEIRLCTYHSSRGLEAERVLIFGLEQIESFARSTSVKPENLGFIVLSRALFRTVVFARSHYFSATHRLLKEILLAQERSVAKG